MILLLDQLSPAMVMVMVTHWVILKLMVTHLVIQMVTHWVILKHWD
jgi:hypothetical protein